MAETIGRSVLQRKAEAGRAAPTASPASPARAFGLALAMAAEATLRLPLRPEPGEERRLSLAELVEFPEDRALLAVLEGPGEAIGLVALSPDLLAALIEMQTTGRVFPGVASPRLPTRTDAAITAGFIDRMLTALGEALAGAADLGWAAGYRYASFLPDPRPLGLILEETEYRLLKVTATLGAEAEKTGNAMLALPAAGRVRRRSAPGAGPDDAPHPPAVGAAEAARKMAWRSGLEQAVNFAPAEIDAVLCRLQMPLSEMLALRPGQVLSVPRAAIGSVALEGPGGVGVAEGRLGQARGFRAVRLSAQAGALPEPPEGAAGAATAGVPSSGIAAE